MCSHELYRRLALPMCTGLHRWAHRHLQHTQSVHSSTLCSLLYPSSSHDDWRHIKNFGVYESRREDKHESKWKGINKNEKLSNRENFQQLQKWWDIFNQCNYIIWYLERKASIQFNSSTQKPANCNFYTLRRNTRNCTTLGKQCIKSWILDEGMYI